MKRFLFIALFLSGCSGLGGEGDTTINISDERSCATSNAFNNSCEDLTGGEGESNDIECRPNENNTGDQSNDFCSTTVRLEAEIANGTKLGNVIANAHTWYKACLYNGKHYPLSSDYCDTDS